MNHRFTYICSIFCTRSSFFRVHIVDDFDETINRPSHDNRTKSFDPTNELVAIVTWRLYRWRSYTHLIPLISYFPDRWKLAGSSSDNSTAKSVSSVDQPTGIRVRWWWQRWFFIYFKSVAAISVVVHFPPLPSCRIPSPTRLSWNLHRTSGWRRSRRVNGRVAGRRFDGLWTGCRL